MSHLLISLKDQKKKVKLSIVALFDQKHHMVAVVNLLTKCKSHIHTYIALVVIKIIGKKRMSMHRTQMFTNYSWIHESLKIFL